MNKALGRGDVTDNLSVTFAAATAKATGKDKRTIRRAARHRLEAAKRLGWTHIDCIYVDLDDLHAQLAEIDENLIRSPLTPAQEAEAIFQRKAIYEELHPETRASKNASNERKTTDNLSFVSNSAQATGKDERTIRRAARRGKKLGSDLAAVIGTSLDKGAELDALANMAPDERKPLIERAQAGETGRLASKGDSLNFDNIQVEEGAKARTVNNINNTAKDPRPTGTSSDAGLRRLRKAEARRRSASRS